MYKFSVKKEKQLNTKVFFDPHFDFDIVVNERGQPFTLSKEVSFPKFVIEESGNSETLINERKDKVRNSETETSLIKQSKKGMVRDANKGEDIVKCLCKHGTCKKGESKCSQCNSGWTGKQCDVPSRSNYVGRLGRDRSNEETSSDYHYTPETLKSLEKEQELY